MISSAAKFFVVTVFGRNRMLHLRKPTIVESAVLVGITAVLIGLIVDPDMGTSTRRGMERRSRDWKQTTVPTLSDASLLTIDVDLSGRWINRHRLTGTSLVFSERDDKRYDVQFSTGGCLGGCSLSRIAAITGGVITLDGAVAEYLPRTYNTLYAVHIGDTDYLVPADGVQEFERQLAAGSDRWKFYVFSRGE